MAPTTWPLIDLMQRKAVEKRNAPSPIEFSHTYYLDDPKERGLTKVAVHVLGIGVGQVSLSNYLKFSNSQKDL